MLFKKKWFPISTWLTIFLVKEYFHLLLFEILEGFFQFLNGGFVCEISIHKATRATFLHDLSPVVTRQLTKAIIAVHDRVVYDPSIGQNKTGIWK